MSRTTTALKRLGVPGLAAVTLVAGLPLFLGTAQAAHIQGLTLSKANSEDAAGVCIPYTVQLNFTTEAQRQVETVDVSLTDNDPATTGNTNAAQDVDFCTAPFGSLQPATPQDVQDGGAAGTDHAEFVTDAAGKVTFGIISNQQGGSVLIRAFYETTDNDTFNAGEFTATQTQVFTTGGGTANNNQDAAEFVEVLNPGQPATATVTADSPDTDTAIEGEQRNYRVLVTNSFGDRLAGVAVTYTLDVSPSSTTPGTEDVGPTAFAVTDNNGVANGTVTFPVRAGTADTTDTVLFYVNQSEGISNRDEATEPDDEVVVNVRDAAQQQNKTVTLIALTDAQAGTGNTANANYSQNGDAAVNPANDGTRGFRAVVDQPDGVAFSATELAFGVTGGSGDETVTPTECTTAAYNAGDGDTTTDANNGFCDVTVTDLTPTVGQTLTLTVTIRGTSAADTATLTFRNQPQDARSIVLTPETVTVAPNTAQQLAATVRDVDGNPVRGVTVRFTENGAGAFRNGNSTVFSETNENGVATAEVISLPGETGTSTVTADISQTATGQGTQCNQAANTGRDPQGNDLRDNTLNPGSESAGVCSDSSTVTFGAASPSPSTPTSTISPSPSRSPQGPGEVPCTVVARVALDRDTITATGSAGITVTGTPNSVVNVLAYSRPSTTFRVVRRIELGADGRATDRIVPPTNTRLYAQQVGCDAGPQIVLNVRTALSLAVERLGTRTYRFSGDSLPARPGGLIISLYRVTNDGRQVLTSQVRADSRTGEWTLDRRFTGTGRFGFVVRTGQDLQNAPGSSNVRSLLVF